MKKSDFYRDIKINLGYAGLQRNAWHKDDNGILVNTHRGLVAVYCSRNVVTLYTKRNGEKGNKVVTDWNTGFKPNMVPVTVEKIYKFLGINY